MSHALPPLALARGSQEALLLPRMMNRHGLVAGATGTGKTVTVRVLAEGCSSLGVPVFLADVKGDLSGLARPGGDSPKVEARVREFGLGDFAYEGFPVVLWDLFGERGHPVRTTVSEMGPLLLARLLNLNETQEGVLSIVFRVADDEGLLLLDLKDLRALVALVGERAAELRTRYGNVSAASVGAIQRGLLALEEQGGARFFGEPALDLFDLLQADARGRGVINILAAERLMQTPKLYATFLLWLLSELFEALPEVGDPEKPRIVFVFDEAHLLFDEAPPALLQKIEQVARLIRSKGVGVYFCTQNPLDVPDGVLGQLGNRVQHALRAFSPREQRAVKAAAETFRPRPGLDVADAITRLGVGEALVSFLDEKGVPVPVDRALVYPPRSCLTPLADAERASVTRSSALYGHYERSVDRDSAYEVLARRAKAALAERLAAAPPTRTAAPPKAARGKDNFAEAFAKSAVRAVGSQVGRQVVRGLLGSLFGGRR